MQPVIQEQETGCAIASCAVIAGLSYKAVKKIANSMGIYASDRQLWSETANVRKLLRQLGYKTDERETPFTGWENIPDCALLAIKWHKTGHRAYWHWVVFVRDSEQSYVLDSNPRLKNPVRRDFGRIKPKWFLKIVR